MMLFFSDIGYLLYYTYLLVRYLVKVKLKRSKIL